VKVAVPAVPLPFVDCRLAVALGPLPPPSIAQLESRPVAATKANFMFFPD
jgi:hypothetical protein